MAESSESWISLPPIKPLELVETWSPTSEARLLVFRSELVRRPGLAQQEHRLGKHRPVLRLDIHQLLCYHTPLRENSPAGAAAGSAVEGAAGSAGLGTEAAAGASVFVPAVLLAVLSFLRLKRALSLSIASSAVRKENRRIR